MIRGINKRIIEVNDTGSEFFEKALFFVKSQSNLDNGRLEDEAKKVMLSYFSDETPSRSKQGYLRYSENKRKKIIITTALTVIAIAAIIAAFWIIY